MVGRIVRVTKKRETDREKGVNIAIMYDIRDVIMTLFRFGKVQRSILEQQHLII